MDKNDRMHLCMKTSYTSGENKYILFEKGKFYKSKGNLIYSETEYSDPLRNRYKVYYDNAYAEVFIKECAETFKGIDDAKRFCYIFLDVKDLAKYNLTVYTMKQYASLFRENRINSILKDI